MSTSTHMVETPSADGAALPAGSPQAGGGKRDPLARQQALVALGRRAVAPPDSVVLMQDAAALLAEMLDTPLSGTAELTADGTGLTMRLRVAGPAGQPVQTLLHQCGVEGIDSLAGHVLEAAHPVRVPDLPREKRFVDLFLRKHAVRSAVAAPLKLPDRAFGALAAYSYQPDYFNDEDLLFVETMAHLAAAAVARAQAEGALAEQQRLAAGVLETVDAMVLVLDSHWQITHVNPACERITGFSLNDVRRRPVWGAFAVPEEAEAFRRALERLQPGQKTIEYESRLLTKHADRRYVAWSCRALPDRRGLIDSVIATGIDVTARREAEARARRAEAAAQEARQMLGAASGRAPSFAPLPTPLNAERRKRPRRSYPYKQLVAYLVDDKLPAPDAFVEVSCNDIAAGGFSFFSPAPPKAESLVVALGIPPKFTYLVAQIAHVARTKYDGEKMYLIGCTYTGRATY